MFINNKIFKEDIKYISDTISPHSFQNKSILITGACGMIGTILCYSLIKAGAKVFGMDISEERMEERFENQDLTFIKHDITKPFNISEKFDFIIHAASNAYPKAFDTDPVGTMLQNIWGIKYILDYAALNNSRVLYISSGEVYGQSEGNDFDELYSGYIDILNPRSCYPCSKRAAETLCSSYIKQYSVDAVIARPSHVYGLTATPSDTRASSEFIRNGVSGNDIIMKSSGSQVRSYTYIADCAAAILYILQNGICGEAYNIAFSKSVVSIREMAQMIADICKVKIKFENPNISELNSYNPSLRSVLCGQKLKDLGFECRFDMYNGLKRTIEALKGEVLS